MPFKSICILVLVAVCVSASTIEKQTQGCSIEGIDLGLCLDQQNNSFSIDGACCKVLNKVVQTGFNCLCLLLASSFPLLTTPISLPLSNCFITVPPLTLCKVLAPMPIVFPPNTPKEVKQPPLLPPPPPESQLPVNSTRNNNSTVMATQPASSRNPNAFVSPPKGMQISTSSTIMAPPSDNNSSPQPSTCDVSHKDNERSKWSEKNRIRFPYYVLFLSLICSLFLLCI